jgi:transposase
MEHYAGINVSLELSSVCVVDTQGKIVKEAKVASEPEALVPFFKALGFAVKQIGLEVGPLSQWLHAGLRQAGFETVLLETRHVKAALSAMMVKTDRNDARGLAQLIQLGWFAPVRRCTNVCRVQIERSNLKIGPIGIRWFGGNTSRRLA